MSDLVLTREEQKLAEQHFEVVDKAVGHCIKRYGFPKRLRDEMVSEAQYCFVRAVARPQAKAEYGRSYLFRAAYAGAIEAVRREWGRSETKRRFKHPVHLDGLAAWDSDRIVTGYNGSYNDPDVGSWESLQGLLERCPNDRYREVIIRLAAGESQEEVGKHLGVRQSRVSRMCDRLEKMFAMSEEECAKQPVRTAERQPLLTPREQDVFDLAMTGRTSDEIAADLYISADTVKSHRKRIQDKIGPIKAHLMKSRGEELSINLLNPREREVFDLAAQGRSSRKIADDLGMPFETVQTHRKHINQKLGPVIAAPGPKQLAA